MLDASNFPDEPVAEQAKEAGKSKKITKRALSAEKDAAVKGASETSQKADELGAPKTRTRGRKIVEKEEVHDAPAPRPRGRPRKAASAKEQLREEPEKPARPARGRAGSGATAVKPTTASLAKATTVPRKKVTFQDVAEDDKENQPITKKTTAKKDVVSAASGMRARPLRKPAATAAQKKKTASSKINEENLGPCALTPKKITQVARSPSHEESDNEDELNSCKTPIRDLSQSPKRNPALAAMLSPVKKLDFTPALAARTTDIGAEFGGSMTSPARRLPAPSDKDGLRESPRRGDIMPIFPTSANIDFNAAVSFVPSTQTQPTLLQSPKRGTLDASIFTQSAIKPMGKTPLRGPLLGSPAKRLFSVAKQKIPAGPAPWTNDTATVDDMEVDEITPQDVTVTSHFRSTMSPQRSARVHKISEEDMAQEFVGDVDFDSSVLNIRSPLKLAKPSPRRQIIQEEEKGTPTARNGPDEQDELAYDESTVHDLVTLEPATANKDGRSNEHAMSEDILEAEATNFEQDPPEHVDFEEEAENGSVNNIKASESAFEHAKAVKPSMPEFLFRTSRFREEDESSEDELAADQTPQQAIRQFRSSLTGVNARSRVSMGFPGNAAQGFGFTPLATQISGWLANSPEKKQIEEPESDSVFSPLAAQHIDGEVMISRQNTPAQRKSFGPRQSMSGKKSARKSMAPRTSFATLMLGSPEKASFFDEEMAKNDLEQQIEGPEDENDDVDLHDVMDQSEEQVPAEAEEDVNSFSGSNQEDDENAAGPEVGDNGELTTDLVNFVHASDTAMVDFEALANEAAELAPVGADNVSEDGSVVRTENEPVMDFDVRKVTTFVSDAQQQLSEASDYGDENIMPAQHDEVWETAQQASEEMPVEDHVVEEAIQLEDDTASPEGEVVFASEMSSTDVLTSPAGVVQSIDMVTPVRADRSLQRFANTVVSKVPLRPEGHVSPIKMSRKRRHSLSGPNSSSKRQSISHDQVVFVPQTFSGIMTPGRRVRSTAPSPAKTVYSVATTPGQTSFMADDFGDSTLDGIDVPDEDMDMTGFQEESVLTQFVGLPPAPARINKAIRSAVTTPARTPLKAVGNGVLHGATVYVDVHTTEGADANAIFVDLLTTMGAKCVKEWRWNPRASLADGENDTSTKVGITHVVYKDGGKRTLEKVRGAHGEVWCVGVGWVLE